MLYQAALCSHSNDFNRSDDRSRKSILLPEISRPMIRRHANKPTAFGHTERFNHSNNVGLRWLNEIITVSWLHIFDVQKLISHFLIGSAHPSAPNRLARKLVLLDSLNLSLSVRQAPTLLSTPTATMMEGGRKLAETPSCCWLGKAKHVGCDAKAAQQNCRPEGDVEGERGGCQKNRWSDNGSWALPLPRARPDDRPPPRLGQSQ